MAFFENLMTADGFFGVYFGYIVAFLFVMTIVVFFHELGHYWVGRLCGIGAETFSIGFGPELFGFTDKHGTRWRMSLIPLGGYVRFIGDMNAASTVAAGHDPDEDLDENQRAKAFHNKSVGRRFATVAAGPIASFLLAIAIFAAFFTIYGQPIADPVVAEVRADSAAESAGLEPGDVFLSLDGNAIASFSDVQRYVTARADVPIQMGIRRGDSEITITVTPDRLEVEDRFGNKIEQGVIGVMNNAEVGNYRVKEFSVGEAIWAGVGETAFVVTRTFDYLYGVITGRERADQISGPIGIAKVTGQVATLGLAPLIKLAAFLSASIGLLNFLPIPVLDGGHLMFYTAEALRGKPLSARTQEFGYRVGFALILSLLVFATWNDLT